MESNWLEVKKKYRLGDTISGKVIRHQPFGIFLDIGEEEVIGFVRIVNITDDASNVYSNFPEVGSTVKGVIVDLTENNHQISVSLRKSDMDRSF